MVTLAPVVSPGDRTSGSAAARENQAECPPRTQQRRTGSLCTDMAQDERGYLIVPHELTTGADCDGCLIIEERGDVADLKCNSCGSVVDTVPLDRAGQRLMELASTEMCSARCPHCGATNVFRGFTVVEAFVCQECGEGVNVELPVH